MPAENNTLTGFILSKATQSRKAAKRKDKSKKKKSKKNTPQQSTNLLTGALSSVTNLFKPDKGKAEEVESKQPRTSGGATGLAKILTEGFGSLTADTLGLAGGLAAITNILNQQLQAQSFTATGVQAITSILTDQLENQSSIVSGVKSLRPGGGGGKAPRAAGGGGGSKGGGGTEGRTLTEALLQRAGDMGIGAGIMGGLRTAIQYPLTIPIIATTLSAFKLSQDSKSTAERVVTEKEKKSGQALTEKQKEKVLIEQASNPLTGGFLIPTLVNQQLENDKNKSSGAIIKHSSGTMKFAGGMTGGTNSMISEAGKEAVVDLNSRSARSMFNAKPSATPEGESDPGMQASGASTLAVVDQFIKGMGPLGAPVAQALGPDISNLARTFGMSQTLPNIKVGGGRFREDAGAKKTRDKFLENLIAGSLEALGAKKKDEKQQQDDNTPAPTGDKNQNRAKENQEQTKQTLENIPGAGKAMERLTPEGVNPAEGETAFTTEKTVKGTQVQLASGDKLTVPSADLNPVVGSNKKYWYDSNGKIYRWNPGEKVTQLYLDEIQKQGKADSFDLVRDLNTGVVRKVSTKSDWNPFNNASTIKNGEYSYRANDKLVDNGGNTPVWSRANEQQDLGGLHGPEIPTIKQSNLTSFDKGGAVKKPWWDFLGWVTGMKSVEQGKTGIYSDAPMGRLADRTANTNKTIQEMMGGNYEKGGSREIATDYTNAPGNRMFRIPTPPRPTPVKFASKSPVTTPARSPVGATNDDSIEMSTATIVNIVQQSQSSIPIPVSNDEGQSTSSYVGDAFGSGIAFSVLTINPWGN